MLRNVLGSVLLANHHLLTADDVHALCGDAVELAAAEVVDGIALGSVAFYALDGCDVAHNEVGVYDVTTVGQDAVFAGAAAAFANLAAGVNAVPVNLVADAIAAGSLRSSEAGAVPVAAGIARNALAGRVATCAVVVEVA